MLEITDQETLTPPTSDDFIRELDGGFDAEAYDAGYADHAKDLIW